MNRLLVLLVLLTLIGINTKTFSQSFVLSYSDVKYTGGEFVPTSSLFVMKDSKSGKFGFSSFGAVTYDWAEILVGPYYKPIPELSIGVQVGFETIDPYWRLGFSTVFYKEKNLLMFFLEKGAGSDNYWYSVEYQNTQRKFVWGLIGQRFYGWGPNCGTQFGSYILTVAPLYDFEAKQFQPTVFFKWII